MRVCAKVTLMTTRGGGIGWPLVADPDCSVSSSTRRGRSAGDRSLTSATILCPPHRTNPSRNAVSDDAPFLAILLDLPLAGTGTFGRVDRSPHRRPQRVCPQMARFISTSIFRALAATPSFFAPELSGALDIQLKAFPGHELLTPRERATLAQIARGASSKEAARALGIGPRTVDFHRKNIMVKLGAKNTVDLVRRVLGE